MSAPASRIVLRPAPRREPPFDDEIASRHLHLVGPYDQQLPFPATAPAARVPTQTSLVDRGGLPDPVTWGRIILTAVLETLAGRRPFRQLAGYLSPAVHNGLLSADTDQVARQRTWARVANVRSIRLCEPAGGVAELAAVVQTGPRVRAIALRLEAHGGRWRCTRLQLG